MKQLTVFTPSYNRAHLLPDLYKSPLRQSYKDFIWLIVDDGSNDGTAGLVKSWIEKNEIEIKYEYQNNQGMHGAHNTAYRVIETELNVCIDSDDFMPDDAVDKALKLWKDKGNKALAGIVALDATKDGEIIGTKLPENETITLCQYYAKGGTGDKKLVYRTEVIKQYPEYGIYEGERLVPLSSKYVLIDQDFQLLVLNEVLCVVEYQEDGSSGTIFKQYKQSPKGFAEARRITMQYGLRFKDRFMAAIHYVSSAVFSNDISFINKSPKPMLTFLAIPMGVALNIYIRYRIRSKS